MKGKYQNNVVSLPDLSKFRYENIFKLYQTGDKDFYYYNLTKKINISDEMEPRFFNYIVLPKNLPLTALSYDIYGTQELWWLILTVNKIQNPIKKLPTGTKIKYVIPEVVPSFIESIQSQL